MPQEKELGGPIYDVKYFQGEATIRFGKDVERKWKDSEIHNSMRSSPRVSSIPFWNQTIVVRKNSTIDTTI